MCAYADGAKLGESAMLVWIRMYDTYRISFYDLARCLRQRIFWSCEARPVDTGNGAGISHAGPTYVAMAIFSATVDGVAQVHYWIESKKWLHA